MFHQHQTSLAVREFLTSPWLHRDSSAVPRQLRPHRDLLHPLSSASRPRRTSRCRRTRGLACRGIARRSHEHVVVVIRTGPPPTFERAHHLKGDRRPRTVTGIRRRAIAAVARCNNHDRGAEIEPRASLRLRNSRNFMLDETWSTAESRYLP